MEILYEDNHLLAINKPAGMLVQGDKTGDMPLVERMKLYLKDKYNKPGKVFLGIPHRLDRPVSGVLLFARTSKALSRLNQAFKEKNLQKTYWAVVQERPDPPSDRLVHFLIKNQAKNKSRAFTSEKKGSKKAILDYELLHSSDRYHLLSIQLHTGRHHQIRVQLSKMGCPIKGDLKYGYARPNKGGFIHLHAVELSLTHPVQKVPLTITAPLPHNDVLWNYFRQQMQ